MATFTKVYIDPPEAADLADYTGIEFDLSSARDFARTMLTEQTKNQPDWSLSDPLMIAIMVRYARPFVTGARKRLTDNALELLTSEQRAKHDNLRAIRDKHVAHSVNAFEENQPTARYFKERVQDEGIIAIGCEHHRIVGLSTQDLNDIVELTTVMLQYVEQRLEEEKKRLLEIVRKMPLDQVLAGEWRANILDTLKPSKRRPDRRVKPSDDGL